MVAHGAAFSQMNRRPGFFLAVLPIAAAAFACLVAPGPADAQTAPEAGGEFTFRTVRPPPPGASKRLIFQPKPSEPRAAQPDGFWAEPGASPGLTPRRALAPLLAAAGPGPSAAAESARRLMNAHGGDFRRAAARSRLSLPLLLAVALAELGGDSRAVSPRGAQGLMQLMPATAVELRADPFAPHEAIPAAALHLSALLARFDEDLLAALAAYNAGAGAVARHRGAPPYAETRAYAPRVLALFGALRTLCLTPPEAARAACRPSAALSPPGRLPSSP